MGDRLSNIEKACRLINTLPGTKLLRTSGLYETKAMYVEDQADFLNGACEVFPPFDIIL
jgi:2-amino-4-hydroxy-6-hydroxymethyldihydropteridine diphosphokinase/dihydropteroate synthase